MLAAAGGAGGETLTGSAAEVAVECPLVAAAGGLGTAWAAGASSLAEAVRAVTAASLLLG